ncbi:MAG: DNRLRE domain-containing protein [Saprospiraceae bacterium]|nr:DNRLRE domain-containing protein [Saprospiraceae bacterium]
MKTNLLIGLAFFLFGQLNAQTTIVLQPGPKDGKDAMVWRHGGDLNYGDLESITTYTWTNNSLLSHKRAFIEFDLSMIPSDAVITDAKFSFYFNPIDQYEGFEFHTGVNGLYLDRISSPWDEHTVTFNSQPTTTEVNRVSIPASTSQTQDYEGIDVTNLIIDMHNSSIGNNGFMIRMADEDYPYRSVIIASSDHPHQNLRPKLEVTYEQATSIKDRDKMDIDLKVYPNPNEGTFNLQITGSDINDYTIEIIDALGKKVEAYEQIDSQVQLQTKGVYIIRLSDEKGNYTIKRVVVQ